MSGICVIIGKAEGAPPPGEEFLRGFLAPVSGAPHAGKALVRSAGKAGVGAVTHADGEEDRVLFEDDGLLVACDAEFYRAPGPPGRMAEAARIAELYRKHGREWFRGVHGTFSAFIWDKRAGRGEAYVDRIGVKSLVYRDEPGRVLIASRLGCISRLPGFERKVDNQAVFSYLHLEIIPVPYTFFQGISKLESGHLLAVGGGRAETAMCWKMSYPEDKIRDEKEIADRSFALLEDAVRMQSTYRTGTPEVAAFLSGGMDSSSIAGLLDRIHPGKARTFSIGFDEQGYDEMHYARIAAKAFKTDHTEYYVTEKDILDALPGIVRNFDEPFGNSSVIPTYFCARIAREKGVKVMLGGDGGDEVFGGNSRYHETFAHFSRYPRWLVDLGMAPAAALTPSWAKVGIMRKVENYVTRSRAPLEEKIHAFSLPYYLDLEKVFSPGFLAGGRYLGPADFSRRYIEQSGTSAPLDQFLYNDLKMTLMDNDLVKVNAMTELAGVQVRYPFLDHALLEFTGRIPPELKVKGPRLRYIFKEAMRRLLPEEIIEKKKHGFGIPVVRWMLRKGPLNDLLLDVVSDKRTRERGFFRDGFVADLHRMSMQDATPYFGTYLYYILFLELWMREHLDR
jgi:asparagine synthase (glutamine-hydrolysing)